MVRNLKKCQKQKWLLYFVECYDYAVEATIQGGGRLLDCWTANSNSATNNFYGVDLGLSVLPIMVIYLIWLADLNYFVDAVPVSSFTKLFCCWPVSIKLSLRIIDHSRYSNEKEISRRTFKMRENWPKCTSDKACKDTARIKVWTEDTV